MGYDIKLNVFTTFHEGWNSLYG